MLHDRHLYTVHKVPVRFQRCLACMVAKQGPCGDHKATWLCRSRLTDAPPGAHVQNGMDPAQLSRHSIMLPVHTHNWHHFAPTRFQSVRQPPAVQAPELGGV